MAYTLIGGTAIGTVLILLFLPALYAAWFRIRPVEAVSPEAGAGLGHGHREAILAPAGAE
jgi:hypothetical protein